MGEQTKHLAAPPVLSARDQRASPLVRTINAPLISFKQLEVS